MDKKVHLNSIMQLFILFTEKKWMQIDSYKDGLKRFGNLIESLTKEQTDLLLELTERYTWLSYNEYNSILRKLFIELQKSKLETVTKLYLFPIKKIDDEDEVKSGDIVQYMLKGILAFIDDYDSIEIILLKKFEELNTENLVLKENEYIVFVDDFIGSGKTLDSTLKIALGNKTIDGNFSILTTIIQEGTVQELLEKNISVLYGKSSKKGISEYYVDDVLESKVNLMSEIENKIPGVKNYRFGFEKSEGLATLMRTPNNTFPIFWKEYMHKKEKFKPPFPRF
jgi:hypothetical protein